MNCKNQKLKAAFIVYEARTLNDESEILLLRTV